MDSRKTAQGDERTDENVVRLPRDWLGPREELVPIGSRAHAAQPPDDTPAESMPPTAASFWDEDSGALQAPMQASADAWSGQWGPAPAEPPTQPERRVGHFAPRRRAHVAAAVGILAACVAIVLSVIGQAEGGRNAGGAAVASSSTKGPIETGRGANLARLKAHTPVVTEIKRQPRSHRSAQTGEHARHSRTPADRRHASRTHHRHHARSVPRPSHSTSEPVRTIATTPATTPTTTAPPTSTPSSPHTSLDRSTGSTSQQQPAFGPTGSLGPGSSPDS
jgi:hypothetical protein